MPFDPWHKRPFWQSPRTGPPPPPLALDGSVEGAAPPLTGKERTDVWRTYTAPPVWCQEHPDREGIAFVRSGGTWQALCLECRRRYPAPLVGKYAPPESPPAQPPNDEIPF